MFLPIVLEPFHMGFDNYYWIYLKYLYACHENNWPIISHRRYIDYHITNPKRVERTPDFYQKHEYRILTEKELKQVNQYVIEEIVFEQLIDEKESKLEAMIFLINNRYKPLEDIIEKYILEIRNITTIEGIMNWQVHFESVKYLANKYDIPLIVNEYGPLRFPYCMNTGCFCCKDIHKSDEVEKRYLQFIEESKSTYIPIFERKEILTLFLNKTYLNMVKFFENKNEVKMGIIGTSPVSAVLYAKGMYDDLQLIQDIRKTYSDNDIVFRKHPGIGDPYQANYFHIRNYDKSINSLEFVSKCEKVASVHSSVIFEAMLMGKPVYSKCSLSQYAFKCIKNYEEVGIPVEKEFVNFIVFSYLVPYSLMLNEEYVRWRMTKPKEIELYLFHLNYYLGQRNVPNEIIKYYPSDRIEVLNNILRRQNDESSILYSNKIK